MAGIVTCTGCHWCHSPPTSPPSSTRHPNQRWGRGRPLSESPCVSTPRILLLDRLSSAQWRRHADRHRTTGIHGASSKSGRRPRARRQRTCAANASYAGSSKRTNVTSSTAVGVARPSPPRSGRRRPSAIRRHRRRQPGRRPCGRRVRRPPSATPGSRRRGVPERSSSRLKTGPTVWITHRASSSPAVVATARPVGQALAVVRGAEPAAVGEDGGAATSVDGPSTPARRAATSSPR